MSPEGSIEVPGHRCRRVFRHTLRSTLYHCCRVPPQVVCGVSRFRSPKLPLSLTKNLVPLQREKRAGQSAIPYVFPKLSLGWDGPALEVVGSQLARLGGSRLIGGSEISPQPQDLIVAVAGKR